MTNHPQHDIDTAETRPESPAVNRSRMGLTATTLLDWNGEPLPPDVGIVGTHRIDIPTGTFESRDTNGNLIGQMSNLAIGPKNTHSEIAVFHGDIRRQASGYPLHVWLKLLEEDAGHPTTMARLKLEVAIGRFLAAQRASVAASVERVYGESNCLPNNVVGFSTTGYGKNLRNHTLETTADLRKMMILLRHLSVMHGQGIVHRDIKPQNVVHDGEWLRCIDFGIAKVMPHGPTHLQSLNITDRPGIFLGTVRYASPEAFDVNRSVGVNGSADIYAAGVMLYEQMTHLAPCGDCNDESQMLHAHAGSEAEVSELADYPDELARLTVDMLEADPAERPTAHEAACRVSSVLKEFRTIGRINLRE